MKQDFNSKKYKEQSEFILDIYKILIDDSYWQPLLEKLADYVDKGKACITSRSNNTGYVEGDFFILKTHCISDEFINKYFVEMQTIDSWILTEQLHDIGDVHLSSVGLEFSELEKTKYYQEWLKPQNITNSVRVQLFKTENYRIVLNVFFDKYTDGVDSLMEDLKTFTPHLSQAVEIWMQSIGSEQKSRNHFFKEKYGLTDREIETVQTYFINNRKTTAKNLNIEESTVKSLASDFLENVSEHLAKVKEKMECGTLEEMKRKFNTFSSD